jgi:uncharacterized protein
MKREPMHGGIELAGNAHPIAHVDIKADDAGASANFYRDVFGWEINNFVPGYPMFSAEGGPGGGFVAGEEGVGQYVKGVLIYLLTNDIDASLKDIESHGGSTVKPRTEIEGGHGAFAIFRDLGGNSIGLYQAPAGQ